VTQVAKYRIEIDRDGCIACGVCYTLDPSHFESHENGKSMVVGGDTDESRSSGTFEDEEIKMAREAEESCPVSVITVTEL
jgi:ferredoxin